MDDPYDEKRATPFVPWKSSWVMPEGRQSVCQIGAPPLVGPQNAPVDTSLDHQSADRSETGRSSIHPIAANDGKEPSQEKTKTLTPPAYS